MEGPTTVGDDAGAHEWVPEGLVLVPAETLVIRGGMLTSPSREKNLRAVREAYGVWGICVKAEPGLSAEQVAAKASLRGKTMMVSVAEELQKAGFPVSREPGKDWPSALILFPEKPTPTQWDELRAVFLRREVEPNPNGTGGDG